MKLDLIHTLCLQSIQALYGSTDKMTHTHSVAVNFAIIMFQENSINVQLMLSLIMCFIYTLNISPRS